jgi:hypothetical protein
MPQSPSPWQEYRRLRRVLVGATVLGLGMLGVGFHLARTRHSVMPLYVGLALFTGMVALGALNLGEFECPNCGETFCCRGWARNLFTRRCLHCRHPKWADPKS